MLILSFAATDYLEVLIKELSFAAILVAACLARIQLH